jgi:hypothetical protein
MSMIADTVLPVVDAFSLPAAHRELLRPGELVAGRDGGRHRLPRYFYAVESWALALATPLTAHFGLWEFMDVDLREPLLLRTFPRYVPCAVTLLAAALEAFRLDVGLPVRVSANGGYRSPSHAKSDVGSLHAWAAAANVFQIGPDLLDTQERIDRYTAVVRRVLPFAWIRPYGAELGMADDHLHVDIGYATVVPRGASEQKDDRSGGGPAR